MTTLSQADQDALDALVEARFELDALSPEHRQRAERVLRVLSALDHLPDEGSARDDLTERTLQRIHHLRHPAETDASPIGRIGGGPPLSLRDLAAVAAIFLVAVTLLWPMLSATRHSAQQIACQANLAAAGHSLAAYSIAHNDHMPRTKARPGADHWWLTGQFDDQGNAQSNSAHLFVLVKSGFAKLSQLACPENPFARHTMTPGMKDWNNCQECSYSYQNQYTRKPLRLQNRPIIAVLSDKNPYFDRGEYHQNLKQNANSPNHTKTGQNVLMSDGNVSWMTSPRLKNRDNIFHVGLNGRDRYTGRETPASLNDSFLVP